MTQTVKRPPAMRETWVQSLGREDPMEKEMSTHSSPLAWKIHGQRSLVKLKVEGLSDISQETGRIPGASENPC